MVPAEATGINSESSRRSRQPLSSNTIRDRLCEMHAANRRLVIKISQRAGDLEDPVVAAGREFHFFGGVAQELQAAGVGFGEFLDH